MQGERNGASMAFSFKYLSTAELPWLLCLPSANVLD